MKFRFPWQRRMDEARAQTVKAQNEYEWAVQQRTTVSSLVEKIASHKEQNGFVEAIQRVARGKA